jgi:hypothetical protein
MTTQPHKTKGAPKPRKPRRLGHLNELDPDKPKKPRHLGHFNVPDPDAMTLGDWQRFRGYDPKTRTYVAQRQSGRAAGAT